MPEGTNLSSLERESNWASSARLFSRASGSLALAVVGFLILSAVWWVGHLIIGRYLPPPYDVARMGFGNLFESQYFVGLGLPRGGYAIHIISTTETVLVGVGLGSVLGTVTGVGGAYSRTIRQIVAPISSVLGTVPILAAAPFFLMWFGVSTASKLALVTVYSAFIFDLYAFRATRNVNPRLCEYARTLGATEPRTFLRVNLPAALPEMFGGARIALGGAWGLAVITELLGSTTGIGRAIIATWGVYDITGMMAGVLWISVIAVMLDACLMWARRWVLRWMDDSHV
jgi:ABC-type nitrate/sulfonate/bicarbonate transport system permease component